MRRLLLLAALATTVLLAGLAVPRPAVACTGCSPSWEELRDSPVIVLAQYRGRSGFRITFDIIDVLKGPEVRTLHLNSGNGMPPGSPYGRWLLIPDGIHLSYAFRVSEWGAVRNGWTGEGEPRGYPRTLAGWYRALGLAVPDTASLPAAQLAPGSRGPAGPLVLLAGALLGLATGGRRFRHKDKFHED